MQENEVAEEKVDLETKEQKAFGVRDTYNYDHRSEVQYHSRR